MKVLLVGSGGREHALAWALAQSDHCDALYCAPGNAGIADCAECVDIAADDVEGVTRFALDNAIDLVVVGPEAPLVKGLADRLIDAGIDVFGPRQGAAALEGSKGFMKDLCAKYKIPTAQYGRFSDVEAAKAFIMAQGAPIVVKADGLAAGKGVIIAETVEQAFEAVQDMLSGDAFGDAGHEVVIEQFLNGEEVSYFALADGKTILPLTSAQDHKRAYDGDAGPNTGGMGAYSPAHIMSDALEQKILSKIIEPTVAAMAAEGVPFTGVLYAGLMIVDGEPFLIEYNVRFGDPECQAILMRLQSDLLEILQAGAQGRLADVKDHVQWRDDSALCVVMAAKGYPGSYAKNTPITGLDVAAQVDGVQVFHAGTARDADGGIVSTGGRVLGVTALGTDVGAAQARAYEAVDCIDWPQGFCRRDIGWRAIRKDAA
ncbi:MAG: phosphoribosylamine--glycine ligase [Bdellovibrionales bacterium]